MKAPRNYQSCFITSGASGPLDKNNKKVTQEQKTKNKEERKEELILFVSVSCLIVLGY